VTIVLLGRGHRGMYIRFSGRVLQPDPDKAGPFPRLPPGDQRAEIVNQYMDGSAASLISHTSVTTRMIGQNGFSWSISLQYACHLSPLNI
jgi:hypothetical protein